MAEESALLEFQKLFVPGGLPELGPGPRRDVLPQPVLTKTLDQLLNQSKLASNSHDLVRSLILLWHDHLDAAHTIAQGIDTANGSFLHGIVHRREPDYGNAAYWLRRVGAHPCFAAIAKRVKELVVAGNQHRLETKLVPEGQWDPLAFIGECEKAVARPPEDPQVEWLRKIQGIESEALLEHFVESDLRS